jgi:hypothetical protein
MDISKAFDTVDHSKLLQKLQEFGFSGSLLLWFKNYLSGRFQLVTVHGATSNTLSITSGVPQGSLLGPFLFSVYINDLPSYVSSSTGVGLFADDTKLFRCIKNPSDALVLQEDIRCLSNENHLHFNQSKCKVLSITIKTSPLVAPYSLAGDLLSFSDAEVDLGITISPKLTWIDQVSKVKSKTNKLLGLIRRSILEMTDIKAKKYLYLQLVGSNLAYASQVWCPQSVQLIENIEKVQRRATKFILNIDDSARPVISGSGITRSEPNDNRIKFLIPFAKTVTFQSTYFIRACKTWNILSENLRDRNIGFYAFKSGLKLYYKNALSNTYNCDDPRTWKSVRVKCKRARSLDGVLNCT